MIFRRFLQLLPSTVKKPSIFPSSSIIRPSFTTYSSSIPTRFPSTTLPKINEITTTQPIVGWWMLGTSGLVFGIVLLGGITRLTESGLSMVDWSLLGSRPPSTDQEWAEYFEKYKQFPEYKILNKGMSVDEFKDIFFYEYWHRMLGRFIGAFVLIPGAYFIIRGYVTPKIRNRIFLINGMVGFQGLLGWYMVKSGLSHDIIEKRSVPRVSQYRLAAHLGSAFIIYSTALMTGFSILSGRFTAGKQLMGMLATSVSGFKKMSHFTTGMIFSTAISGAFVAGLDAGLIYNTFPLMADRWIPSDLLAFKPLWTNFFENSTTVQFDHRVLAMSTYFVTMALWLWSRRLPLPKNAKFASNLLFGVANMQIILGISTLLYMVPVPLAAAHQGGSLTLLTCALYLQHLLKHLPK